MKSVENTGQSGGAQFKFSVTDCEGEFNVVVVSCAKEQGAYWCVKLSPYVLLLCI